MTWKNNNEWGKIKDLEEADCGLSEDTIADSRRKQKKTANNHSQDPASISSSYFRNTRLEYYRQSELQV
jgi:hypothetical protein